MNRRTFAKTALATAAAGLPATAFGNLHESHSNTPRSNKPFKMNYAPHDGLFKHAAGKSVLDQIRFAHDLGFTAWEDNRMLNREPSEQKAIGDLLHDLGMTMGTFVIYVDVTNPVLTGNRLDVSNRLRDRKAVRELLRSKITEGIDVAKRCGSKWATFVPAAADLSLPHEYQTANVVDHMKFCAELCEPSGLTLLLEPLNPTSHPALFLQRIPHAHQICKMVGSPSVKILDDLFHQQMSGGNLINAMDDAWDEIAYIQFGDVPGRKEPNTGEINFANIVKWLREKNYDGVIGMEHGIKNSEPEGEDDLIRAYRSIDANS